MEGFIDPNQVLDKLDLEPDMIATEFGCGSGGFTIPLAKRLNKGRVYGLDVQKEPLSALEGRASLENLNNIETRRCDLEQEQGSGFPAEFLDLVLIPNVLFQAEHKQQIIKEAERILKKGGQLLIVDWVKESKLGPKQGRVSPEEVKEITEDLNLELTKEFKAGKYHWGLIFRK